MELSYESPHIFIKDHLVVLSTADKYVITVEKKYNETLEYDIDLDGDEDLSGVILPEYQPEDYYVVNIRGQATEPVTCRTNTLAEASDLVAFIYEELERHAAREHARAVELLTIKAGLQSGGRGYERADDSPDVDSGLF